MAGFIEFTCPRLYFRFGEFANRFLQQQLFFGKLRIQKETSVVNALL
jgi:hypothetical protein